MEATTLLPPAESANKKPKAVQTEPETYLETHRRILFVFLVVLQMLMNFEAGAVPALLLNIQDAFALDFWQQGMLGGIVYLGMTVGSFISGKAFTSFSPKPVMLISIWLHIVTLLAFALSYLMAPDAWLLYVSRFGIGISQAFVTVYSPVWVDEFAPPGSQTTWMSLLQGGVPIGICFGYIMAGMLQKFTSWQWYFSFILPAVALVPVAIGGAFVSRSLVYNETLHVRRRTKSNASSEAVETPTRPGSSSLSGGSADPAAAAAATPEASGCFARMWHYVAHNDVWFLFKCRTFVFALFTLTSLYFVVTGIQFWVTAYMVKELGGDADVIVLGFGLTSTTAPTLGVFFGGWVVDYLGGYTVEGGAMATACKFTVVCGFVSALFATPVGFIHSIGGVIALLWGLLFFGGAIVAPTTGIIVSGVPKSMRKTASALSVFCFNFFGYFMSTFVSGIVMHLSGNMVMGFRLIMFTSYLGLIGVVGMWWSAKQACQESSSRSLVSDEVTSQRGAPQQPNPYQVLKKRAGSIVQIL